MKYRFWNTYDCPCGCTWGDAWECMTDDDCPACGTTCAPSDSEDLQEEDLEEDEEEGEDA